MGSQYQRRSDTPPYDLVRTIDRFVKLEIEPPLDEANQLAAIITAIKRNAAASLTREQARNGDNQQ